MPPKHLAAKLAAKISTTREAFEAVFDATRPGGSSDFKTVALSAEADDSKAYTLSLQYALDNAWIHPLVGACLRAGFADYEILEELSARLADGAAPPTRPTPAAAAGAPLQPAEGQAQTLQSMVDISRGFTDPVRFGRDVLLVSTQTCVVLRNNIPIGTGLLIAPGTVLTAWHVIHDEIDANGQPKADAAPRMQVEFDRVDWSGHSRPTPVRFNLATDWLVDSSPCHPSELRKIFPDASVDLSTYLDYALLRLAQTVEGSREWYKLDKLRPIDAGLHMLVFQHPSGWNLRMDHGKVKAVPSRPRFFHNANTDGGSSGGPCFDWEFQFVGLHQAGHDPKSRKPRGPWPNRGVPATSLEQTFQRLKTSAIWSDVLWQLDGPVFGRREYQRWILESAGRSNHRIISVRGDKGQGKGFSLDLLRALVGRSSDVVCEFRSGEIKPGPEDFIDKILSFCGKKREPKVDVLTSEQEANTSRSAWLKNFVVPESTAIIEKAAEGRRVWIAIDDLDQHPLVDHQPVKEYLGLLLENVPTLPWLRILLLGYQDPFPQHARSYTQEERLSDPDVHDVERYLVSHFSALGLKGVDLAKMARSIYDVAVTTARKAREAGESVPFVQILATATEQFVPPLPAPQVVP